MSSRPRPASLHERADVDLGEVGPLAEFTNFRVVKFDSDKVDNNFLSHPGVTHQKVFD